MSAYPRPASGARDPTGSSPVTRRTAPGRVSLILGIGAATAAAHMGNNFTTYLIGGLMDHFGFTPVQMGAWSMTETLAYATAMFLVAPRVASLSPRLLMIIAGALVVAAQLGSAALVSYVPLLIGRVMTGCGFGLANSALNLAAGRREHPAHAISAGIAVQTVLFALINIGLPFVGAHFGVAGMFEALAGLSAVFTLAAGWLPAEPGKSDKDAGGVISARLGPDGSRVLVSMALFTFGSLAIWPFIERAAHAINLSAVTFGRYQSVATLVSALGNFILALIAARLRLSWSLTSAVFICAGACAALTTVSTGSAFGWALILFNASWFICYPLLLGIAYAVDEGGRLAVLSSGVWLLMMSLGSLATGVLAQALGGYRMVGPLGMVFCLISVATIWPLARRLDAGKRLAQLAADAA
jgi:predicted MFS family arabinose efflux permease